MAYKIQRSYASPFQKGRKVTFEPSRGIIVQATVETAHRDGTITVRAERYIYQRGHVERPYLNYKYRAPTATFTLVYEPEQNEIYHTLTARI